MYVAGPNAPNVLVLRVPVVLADERPRAGVEVGIGREHDTYPIRGLYWDGE